MATSVMFMLVADLPARGQERIACSERPASHDYWSWREIEGRRCWFVGHRTMPKAQLYWRRGDDGRNSERAARTPDHVRITDRVNPVRSDRVPTQAVREPTVLMPYPPVGDTFPRRWRN